MVYKDKLLTSSLQEGLKVPPSIRKENNESPKVRANKKADKEKVPKGFTKEYHQE